MDTWLVLGLYVFGILGGAYVGHEMARGRFIKHIDDALKDSFVKESAHLRMIIDLRNQLAKFHTQRDEKGRFTKRV